MPLSSRAAFLGLFLAFGAHAQEVTEEQFLSAFGEQHDAVRALRAGLARAQAEHRQAGTLANPRVDVWHERPDGNPRVTNWTLAWTPPLDGRYGLRRAATEAGVRAAEEHLHSDAARLRAELRFAFARWSLAVEHAAGAQGHHERVRVLAERERERARVGESSGLAARRLALAEAEAHAAAAEAAAQQALAEASARAWRPDLPAGAAPARVALPDLPAESGPENTPELRAFRFELDQARLQERLAGRFWGFPEVVFGWQRQTFGGAVQGGAILAASWRVPLFDRDQAARAEAARLKDVAGARLALATVRVRAEIDGRRASYRTLLAAARDTESVTTDADHVATAAEQSFRAGESTLTDLVDALRSAADARARRIELRGQALAAHRDLEAALGQPLSLRGRP